MKGHISDSLFKGNSNDLGKAFHVLFHRGDFAAGLGLRLGLRVRIGLVVPEGGLDTFDMSGA